MATEAEVPPPPPEGDLIPLAPPPTAPSPPPAEAQGDAGDLIPLQPVAIPVPAPQPQSQPAPQPPSCSKSIADVLWSGELANTDLVVNLASSVGVSNMLDGIYTDQPFTVFVPSDAAIANSGIDWAAVNADTIKLVLNNHIIPGQSLQVQDFVIGGTYPTLTDGKLLQLDSPLSPVVEQTVTSCNLVVHRISTVIVPTYIGQLPTVSAASATQAASTASAASSSNAAQAANNPASSGSSVEIKDITVGDNSFSSAGASFNGGWGSWSFSGTQLNIGR